MINVEDLLKPIADDKPCGEDFTYDPAFQNLETLALGKPETQFSPPEDPDWKAVEEAAVEVLGKSKHLGAAVILTVALLKTGGLEGFRDGLAVVRGLTEKYWNELFPKLDPGDNSDPTERLNILNNLSSTGAPYKCLTHLRQVVLCQSSSLGRFTLKQILSAREKAAKPDPSGAAKPAGGEPDLNQIQAAFRDAGPEAGQANLAMVEQLISDSGGIESFLESTLGSGKGVNFENLDKLLVEMKRALESLAPQSEEVVVDTGDDRVVIDPVGGGGGGKGTRKISGAIQTRDDVIKTLDLICDYYRDNEPSSPVPLILQRAQRLVDKDFMTIVNDLTPDALTQLRVITGAKEGEK